MKIRFLIATVLGLAMLGTSVQADLILNGDFEAGTSLPVTAAVTNWTSWTEITGTGPPVGWAEGSHAGGLIDVADSGDSGTVVANLAALNSLSQDITTVIGTSYDITYMIGALGGTGTPAYTTAELTVSQDGTIVGTNIISQTAGGAGFIGAAATLSFVATDTTTTILFENTVDPTGDDFGIVIDNVSVNAIPEPGSLAMLSLAGFGLAFRRRR